MSKKSITTFVASFLILGFMFLALPQNGYTQEITPGCCQYTGVINGPFCANSGGSCKAPPMGAEFDGFFPGSECNRISGFCSGIEKDIPTLSEWGLIAMAGALGLIGFMVIRRRRIESAGI